MTGMEYQLWRNNRYQNNLSVWEQLQELDET